LVARWYDGPISSTAVELSKEAPLMKCPACGQENAESTPLCRKCGAKLPEPVAQESSTEPAAETPSGDAEILELMGAGQKIQAVKLYRERHGVGLKEAKDAVEALAAEHGIASQSSGCAGVVLLGFVGLGVGALCLLT
jgi:hypothetical protein